MRRPPPPPFRHTRRPPAARPGVEPLERRDLLATFLVTNTADNGDNALPIAGSLRAAMVLANANPGPDNVFFSIPASLATNLNVPVSGFNPTTQIWTIQLVSTLPPVSDPVTIDAYTQAHSGVPYRYPLQMSSVPLGDPVIITSAANTQAALVGNDARIRVAIDGSLLTGNPIGLQIQAPNTNIRGLAIGGFDVGIALDYAAIGTRIQGNAIGPHVVFLVDPQTGSALPASTGIVLGGAGNASFGIVIDTTNVTIGGTAPQENNLVNLNGADGIRIKPDAIGNLVLGNQIGVIGPTPSGRYFQLPNGASGVVIESSGNTVGGAVSGAGNIVSANTLHGVWIRPPTDPDAAEQTPVRNVVEGNYIGAAPGGGFVFGAGDPGNGGDGVRIENVAATRVGGATDLQRNIIVANHDAGVRISGASAVENAVLGNFIGALASGTSVLGNGAEGVRIELGATSSTIGPRNLISGNLRGISIVGPATTGHVVRDNLVGTDASGAADLGNALEGVRIENSPGNQIIGSSAGSQVISGNDTGVVITGALSTGNLIAGTFIGVTAAGDRDLGNSRQGVWLDNVSQNTIGGTTATAANLISANQVGIEITGPSAIANVVAGNKIGTDLSGSLALGNRLDGVWIRSGATSNQIGGSTANAGNRVAFNRRDGVRIEGQSVGNAILSNAIFNNTGLGINLVSNSGLVVPNDPLDADTGPNELQNAPSVSKVRSLRNATQIEGQIQSLANTKFTIQLFANNSLDPSGSGEGEIYLTQATVTTDSNGNGVYLAVYNGLLAAGQAVTATATDPSGNTSEFSGGVAEQIGVVQLFAATARVLEDVGLVQFAVERVGGSGGYFTVDYTVKNGSATAGDDYNSVETGTLIFSVGETVQSILISITNDSIREVDETILISISNPVGPVTLGNPTTATLTIIDDDQPGAVRFSSPQYVVDEASGVVNLIVERDGKGGAVTVSYDLLGVTAQAWLDFDAAPGTVVFLPGQTRQTIAIAIAFDQLAEPDETFVVQLRDPTNGLTLGAPNATIVTIRNSVPPTPPSVTGVTASGNRVLVRYNEPLDPSRAVDLRNYGFSVEILGTARRRLGRLVGISTATYNPSQFSVTLALTRSLPPATSIRITINAAITSPPSQTGVADLEGTPLDGNLDGKPGGTYTTVVQTTRAARVSVRAKSRRLSQVASDNSATAR